MRILQINNAEEIGGGSERVYQLTTRMLLDREHDVGTLSCGTHSFDERKHSTLLPRNDYFQRNPIHTLRNIRDFIYRPQAEAAVRTVVREFRPHLAHLHIFYGQLSSAVLATLAELGVPCVMTVHEYRMLCPVSTLYTERQGVCERCAGASPAPVLKGRCNRDSLPASGLSALEVWFRNRYYPYAQLIDHFFMVSQFCLRKHVQYLPALGEKSSVLYNFVRDAEIADKPQAVAADAPFIYAGRLSREKGLALLCDAFARRPGLRLHVAGDGPLAGDLSRRYASCSNIRFLGQLGGAVLRREVATARFSIVPSEWYENNPMSILESFAAGTPVLGAAIGGIPELVQQGLTGDLFAPSDLADLLRALDAAVTRPPVERDAMGHASLRRIREQHSEEGYYAALTERYRSVLARRATAIAV